jgi:hypothetical protein
MNVYIIQSTILYKILKYLLSKSIENNKFLVNSLSFKKRVYGPKGIHILSYYEILNISKL